MYVLGILTGFVIAGIIFSITDAFNKLTVKLEKRMGILEAKYRGWFKEGEE